MVRRIGLVVTILVVFSAASASAARNDLELVPLFDNSQPLETCGQKAATVISYKNEWEQPTNMFLFIKYAALGPALPSQCIANPLLAACLPLFTQVSEIGDFKRIRFDVNPLPNLQVFVGALTTNTSDSIAYSKVINVNFQPCANTSATPIILPGNGAPTVSMANRGPNTSELYNDEPVAKWASDNMQIIGGTGSPSEYTVSLVANDKNIDKVYLIAQSSTNQLGHVVINGTATRMDRENGVKAYTATIRANDFAAGRIYLKAIVVPLVGKPIVMETPLEGAPMSVKDTDRHRLWLENNRDNHITLRTYYIGTNGTDNGTCGTASAPCRTMTGASVRHRDAYGNNFSGVKFIFGAGVFTWGSTLGWPGFATDNGPLTVVGTVNSLGKKLTTFNRRLELDYLGYFGQPMIGGGNLVIRDVNVKADPTGPDPRGTILGSGDSQASASLVITNTDIEGLGRNPGTCLQENDHIVGTHATLRDVSIKSFEGNGNQYKHSRTFVSHTSSIAFSNNNLILNSAASVNHTVDGCTPSTTPHGDLVKSAGGNLYIDGFSVPKEDNVVAQGFYPTGSNIVVRNAKFRVAAPGVPGYGAALLMGNIRNIYVENSSFVGGTLRYGPCEIGACNYDAVNFANSFVSSALPSLDAVYTQSNMPGNPWTSTFTGVRYSTGSGQLFQ